MTASEPAPVEGNELRSARIVLAGATVMFAAIHVLGWTPEASSAVLFGAVDLAGLFLIPKRMEPAEARRERADSL